ncbi:hypothetical protein FGG78_20160 [Thioclava sp. BHET1]|nr:hypothetical protein FGG78_20160 [Thioclava sp. BHET1]
MRFCEAGSIQSAIQRAYDACDGLKKVGEALGVLPSTLSYGTEVREDRPGGLGVNYLDRLCRMSPKAAVVIAQHFAAIAGGVFQPIAAAEENLVELSAIVAKESGEAQAAMIRASHSASRKDYAAAYRETLESIEAQSRALAQISALLNGRIDDSHQQGALIQ